MKKKLIITIDGPAGAGKSTVSKALARKLSYIYLDTGALYRAFAYKVLKEGLLPSDKKGLADLCSRIEIYLENIDGNLNVFVDGENVTKMIRSEEVGLLASAVSAVPIVRERLLSIQREVGEKRGVVAEGRDMGTVVFPYADHKFYLDADVQERIRRRYNELLIGRNSADYKTIAADLIARDRQDQERDAAPLKASEDAFIIDSTRMSVAEVVEGVISIIEGTKG
ncbi:MAG TPA: (d)CMP kinase [Syntrophales bacterium]|nr:(d)CMP kinase [Syntrophales bacterium]